MVQKLPFDAINDFAWISTSRPTRSLSPLRPNRRSSACRSHPGRKPRPARSRTRLPASARPSCSASGCRRRHRAQPHPVQGRHLAAHRGPRRARGCHGGDDDLVLPHIVRSCALAGCRPSRRHSHVPPAWKTVRSVFQSWLGIAGPAACAGCPTFEHRPEEALRRARGAAAAGRPTRAVAPGCAGRRNRALDEALASRTNGTDHGKSGRCSSRSSELRVRSRRSYLEADPLHRSFPPGGSADLISRAIAPRMSESSASRSSWRTAPARAA